MPVAGPRGLGVAPQAQLRVDRPQEAALPRPRRDPVRVVPRQRHEVQAAVRPHQPPRRRVRFGRKPGWVLGYCFITTAETKIKRLSDKTPHL